MEQQQPIQGLSALLLQLYDLSPSEVTASRQFQSLKTTEVNKETLLSSIPATSSPSYRPLHLIYVALTELAGPWPTLALIRCHARILRTLPNETNHNTDDAWKWLPDATAEAVKRSYNNLTDFIPQSTLPALRSQDSGLVITHHELHECVRNFQLPIPTDGKKPTVAIALPNGPLLAAACVATMTYYIAAPINPTTGSEQFRADILQAGAKCIITTPEDYERLELGSAWVLEKGIHIFGLSWLKGTGIQLKSLQSAASHHCAPSWPPNQANDIVLTLFTSGTSGTKKVVPLKMHSIIAGIVFVVDSWGLTPNDVCLNMMPLYHVGGLVRNILAPLFSGGSTVCCSTFDPNLFWDVMEDIQPTWYYASPSMHSVILAEAPSRPSALQKNRLRLACNAAGGLLPSLACQLRDTFGCVVLPSYGMTECMPISTPPLDYKLDREGTSGISTGPELTILDWSERLAPPGTVGRICVKGEPVFSGYLRPDGTFDTSPFNAAGWFDTGDLGYLDDDGYLYITGRSKEVINRGGELISPFEVENAIMSAALSSDSPISGRVSQVLAFSARHDILQEVVGVVLVSPSDVPRVDLKTLQSAVKTSLQQAKWPVVVVYMPDLPKKNNKVLRIKLGDRLCLPEFTDDTPYIERHREAECPPPDVSLSVEIPSHICTVDQSALLRSLDLAIPGHFHSFYRHDPVEGGLEVYIAPATVGSSPDSVIIKDLKQHMLSSLHNYMIPQKITPLAEPLPRDAYGNVDEVRLQAVLDLASEASLARLAASTEGKVVAAFAKVLAISPQEVPRNVDFFDLGGDSLRAGRLVSILRSTFNVQLPISVIFEGATVSAIALYIEELEPQTESEQGGETFVAGCLTTYSSTNPFLMLLQLVPLVLVYPLRRATQWTIFLLVLSYSQEWPTHTNVVGRLFNLSVSVACSRIAIRIIAPFIGILAKWLIIGRYREGLYPMWGWYHTRWWMVQKIVSVCGKGIFSLNDTTKAIYCRLMGARVGRNVKLAGAALGEWDLLDIQDGVTLTRCICRPFAVEGNTSMYLGKIVIGEGSSVGISSIIAAGAVISPNTCIGINSSTWEMQDADEENRDLSPAKGVKPHWLLTCLLTTPLSMLAWFLSLLPWVAGLLGMVLKMPAVVDSPVRAIVKWFTDPERVGYHYLALILRCLLSPYIMFLFAVLIKKILDVIFGKMKPTDQQQIRATDTWRAALIKTILPVSRLHDVTAMFGQHYEVTSAALRLLGAQIGKRVYWPGTGPSIGDYHLLNVGNDVVFGSRAHLLTSDGLGSEPIVIRDRAMIADRVCLLPGVEVGERTTMGSGALTKRGKSYASNGIYVGSKGRDAVCLSAGTDNKARTEKTPNSRMHHMSSDDTLRSNRIDAEKAPARNRIHHMSSDDTLADTRAGVKSQKKQKFFVTAEPLMSSDSDTDDPTPPQPAPFSDGLSPFGRAFYLRLAPYYVLGPFAVFCYSSFLTVFTSFYWNIPSIASVQIVSVLMDRFIPTISSTWVDVVALYLMSIVTIAIMTTAQAMLALGVVIVAKWALLGRRKPGNYDWDKSSYCQRWQLFLSIEKLRRHCYRGHGVLGLLTGTNWIVQYFRALGADIGQDCAIFASGSPSLMFTEPDLITVGNRVSIDDASVVAHINTRGKFDLNSLKIGDRCVLRSGSRLLSGAEMEDDSCLLEHTLIMGGDVVENKTTMQGWPADRFRGRRIH